MFVRSPPPLPFRFESRDSVETPRAKTHAGSPIITSLVMGVYIGLTTPVALQLMLLLFRFAKRPDGPNGEEAPPFGPTEFILAKALLSAIVATVSTAMLALISSRSMEAIRKGFLLAAMVWFGCAVAFVVWMETESILQMKPELWAGAQILQWAYGGYCVALAVVNIGAYFVARVIESEFSSSRRDAG